MSDENELPEDRPVPLKDIASKIGRNPGTILKVSRSRGFQPFKLQEGQNKPNFLSAQDAKTLIQKLEDEAKYRVNPEQEKAPSGISGVYAIEIPSYDGAIRLKIGWSDNIADRLDTYRTIVPDLRVSRIWPCFENWHERMALKWAGQNGRQISQELFDFEDNVAALSSLDDLFLSLGIMPQTTAL